MTENKPCETCIHFDEGLSATFRWRWFDDATIQKILDITPHPDIEDEYTALKHHEWGAWYRWAACPFKVLVDCSCRYFYRKRKNKTEDVFSNSAACTYHVPLATLLV